MISATLAVFVVLAQLVTVEGTVADVASWWIDVRVSEGTTCRVGILSDADETVTAFHRWDGTSTAAADLRPGDRVRVLVSYEPLASITSAVRVDVGPPTDPPDLAFVAAMESWVAAGCHSVYEGLDRETGALVANLGSRSYPVRERSTRMLGAMDRAELTKPLAWAREILEDDPEVRERIEALLRAKWLVIAGEMEEGR